MKFIVSSSELLQRLQIVGKAIASKSALPIMENFLFSVEGQTLTIIGSDTEARAVTHIDITNEANDGNIAIPGGKLIEYLKLLPEQPLTFIISDENHAIQIVTSSGKNNQTGLDAGEYPEGTALDPNDNKTLEISADTLLAGLSKALFATGSDDLRPVMNGILFDIENEQLTFVATDSHKLVRYTRTDVRAGYEASFILNKRSAALLKNIITKDDDTIRIEFDAKQVIFTSPNYSLTCRLLEGRYPQYRSVIPTNNPYKVTINRLDLLSAIGRVSPFADGSSLTKFEISSNSINVATQDLDFSCSAYETVPCQYEGEPMSIGFKGQFFNDILSNMDAQEIVIQLSDPSRAGLIIPAVKRENEDELMLLMPMKI